MSELIDVQRDGAIATLVLNNPDKRNALSLEAWRLLGERVAELSADEAVRCVVLRGAGRDAFSSGADISEFESERANRVQAWGYGKTVEAALHAIARCTHPTIAMIQGECASGGLEIASVCDLRFCGRSSRFGIPVARLGVALSYEELRGLLALIGRASTLELLLEGRLIGAKRAERLGLVNRVFANSRVEKKTLDVARRVATGAPLVGRWHKRFIDRLSDPTPLDDKEQFEAYAFADTEDYGAGRAAFLADREPEFGGP